MFVCKVCGKEVKAGQAFCPTCGADVVANYETICPVCGAKNSAGSKFCAECGCILQIMRKPVCVVCGAENLPGAKFCVVCGGPIKADVETHTDADMIDQRKAKRRLDNMERERMAAVDKEIAEKRMKTAEERELAMQEVDEYRRESEAEYERKAKNLDSYREKLNELGAEDVEMLKNVSGSLKDQAKYYADPYSQIDEDEIDEDVYVCPACGTINPITVTKCTHCGRNKARALLLLAKGKIKQSPPIKRKKDIIPAPENDLEVEHVPTFDEYIDSLNQPVKEEPVQEEPKKEPADFSGPYHSPYGAYPYPPYPYPYPPYPYGYPYPPQAPAQPVAQAVAPQQEPVAQAEASVQEPVEEKKVEEVATQETVAPQPAEVKAEEKKAEPNTQPLPQPQTMQQNPYMMAGAMPYQMPPIIQPVAFVPYVTQEQPLVQYSPMVAESQPQKVQARPVQARPVQAQRAQVARPAQPQPTKKSRKR